MTEVVLGFFLALAESGLGLGAVLPGEIAISGLAANIEGALPLIALAVAVALGATAGDHLGWVIGRLSGPRLRESRVIARLGVTRWDRAASLIQRHGFWAVLASRIMPFVRSATPLVAGAARLRYRTFAAASVLGAVAWSTVWVGAGAGIAASGILQDPWLLGAVATGVALAVLVRLLSRRCSSSINRAPSPRNGQPLPCLRRRCLSSVPRTRTSTHPGP